MHADIGYNKVHLSHRLLLIITSIYMTRNHQKTIDFLMISGRQKLINYQPAKDDLNQEAV